MEKLKTYGCLILALISVFMLGAYSDAVALGHKEIELHQWVMTSTFGLVFLGAFLEKYISSTK